MFWVDVASCGPGEVSISYGLWDSGDGLFGGEGLWEAKLGNLMGGGGVGIRLGKGIRGKGRPRRCKLMKNYKKLKTPCPHITR